MRVNLGFKISIQLATLVATSVLVFIIYFLIKESAPILQEIGISKFFNNDGWHPLEGSYSLVPMLVGSILVALGSVLVATPLGIILAIFGQFYAPKPIAKIYKGMIELLAGIPSVVFGFWGLIILVPWITRFAPPGASVLAGIIVLTMMILPLVVLTSDAALAAVPGKYIRSAQALGLSRWGIIHKIALPVAMPGILSGVILQAGRALGETMAILMVTGNVVQIPGNIFEPVRTLTANIALEMAYATGEHRLALFVSGLALLVITMLLITLAYNLKNKKYA